MVERKKEEARRLFGCYDDAFLLREKYLTKKVEGKKARE